MTVLENLPYILGITIAIFFKYIKYIYVIT